MSLINQMLKDLEARRAAEAQPQGGIFKGLTSGLSYRRSALPLVLGAIVISVAITGTAGWYWFGQRTKPLPASPVSAKSAPVATTSPAAIPLSPQPKPPAAAIAPPPKVPARATVVAEARPAAAPRPKITAAVQDHEQLSIIPRAPSAQQKAAALYQEAVELLRTQKTRQAEAKLQQALKIDPGYAQAGETLGVLLINAGRVVEAEQIIDQARLASNGRPLLQLLAARIRVVHGDEAGAVALLEEGLPYSGGRADYVAFLAALYQKQGRYRESAAAYERAVALEPGDAPNYVGLAISDEALGKKDEALLAYRHALAGNLPDALRDYAEKRQRALQASAGQ